MPSFCTFVRYRPDPDSYLCRLSFGQFMQSRSELSIGPWCYGRWFTLSVVLRADDDPAILLRLVVECLGEGADLRTPKPCEVGAGGLDRSYGGDLDYSAT